MGEFITEERCSLHLWVDVTALFRYARENTTGGTRRGWGSRRTSCPALCFFYELISQTKRTPILDQASLGTEDTAGTD